MSPYPIDVIVALVSNALLIQSAYLWGTVLLAHVVNSIGMFSGPVILSVFKDLRPPQLLKQVL